MTVAMALMIMLTWGGVKSLSASRRSIEDGRKPKTGAILFVTFSLTVGQSRMMCEWESVGALHNGHVVYVWNRIIDFLWRRVMYQFLA